MLKTTNKTNISNFFKSEILATRIVVDNLRKEKWKESIIIPSLYEQNKFKSPPKKKLTRPCT